ncbi:allantoinase AllB [Lipingzhangella sp. LS1_29]|uniref:allantoinase n=1 Tax=Lipingzhangella rawalii TaxID=2055835 RepID=A0ABU2H7A1_9ACTN|nr:allantoinase AllB [Lipingzhangella rawalii]MDS1271192.1 allantoinase AllB [Lipingzhangella rawalii]
MTQREHGADLDIHARRAITPQGERSISIRVRHGRIAELAEYRPPVERTGHQSSESPDVPSVDLGEDEVLLPGLVDSHVHVNEPGRTEWEGFATATRAAAAGGITTIVDMPLNSIPPTTTVEALHTKQDAARGKLAVDVGFWGGAVPENLTALPDLYAHGVYGFKAFLSPSGVEEFGHLSATQYRQAAETIAELGGQIIVHAEDPNVLSEAPPAHGTEYANFLASRPDTAEHSAIQLVIDLARRTGVRSHVLHLSSASAVPLIADARAEGLPVTVETCPHYLTLTAERVPDGGTSYKCCPPIRDSVNRDRLWSALRSGLIDCVVSDHSPSTPELKHLDTGDFGTAWGGVSSLQVGLSAVWTEARQRGYTLADVVRWMAEGPARVAGISDKGRIAVGADADFAVLAPEETWNVSATALQHRNPVSAYDGAVLHGVVRRTWLRGHEVTGDSTPVGVMLSRT